jgi:hypothetical protein
VERFGPKPIKGGEVAEAVEAREAKHGSRMIEIRVRLWTDNIVKGKGMILPKHAWDAGVVRMEPNDDHRLTAGKPIPFNGMADLPSKIERLLIDRGIKVHLSSKQRRYLVTG